MAARGSGSVTTTKCRVSPASPIGACRAMARHCSSSAGSTGRVRSRRLRTARVVVNAWSILARSRLATSIFSLHAFCMQVGRLLPNASGELLPKAGARHERTLEGVGCRRSFGKDLARLSKLPTTRRAPHRQPTLRRLAPASDGHAEKGRGRLDLRHQHLAATHDPETPRLRRLQARRVFWYRPYV